MGVAVRGVEKAGVRVRFLALQYKKARFDLSAASLYRKLDEAGALHRDAHAA
ncbi:MAG TPA: hypothetical protein VFY12_11270 [Arenimonas sp.]|nr:hypothetical protein [Arenimonas sp.]